MRRDPSAVDQLGQVIPPEIKLATELAEAGNAIAAVSTLRSAIQESSSDWRLHNTLGDVLVDSGREEEAIGAFIRAFQLKPDLASACVKIGRAFFSRGLTDPALFWLRRAMEIDSSNEAGMVTLAVAEAQSGCRDRVASLLKAWVSADPGNPIRCHLAAAIMAEAVPIRASDEYVTTLFDSYADKFDESLAKLHYRGPQLVADALADLELHPDQQRDVLDLGCGTGMVGEVLRPFARRLVGVDLSPNMLRKSADRGLYNELCRSEIVSFMQSRPLEFDLIAGSDLLTYVGDLDEFGPAAAGALRPEGWLIVVLESFEALTSEKGYRLNRSGRYSHQLQYVKQCLLKAGFVVEAVSDLPMRNDLGRPLPSLTVAARKTSSEGSFEAPIYP
jgi:predicted TPR repeat methyltransferase